LWLAGSPDGGGVSMFSQFPTELTALYIRGRVGFDEANRIVAHCPSLQYVTVRVFANVQLLELTKFAQILVRELKQLRSLELMVLSEQSDALNSKLRGEDLDEPEAIVEKRERADSADLGSMMVLIYLVVLGYIGIVSDHNVV
ncbi:hypothetical protein FRC07_014555, partial [Ceratobasidium sp. 392]